MNADVMAVADELDGGTDPALRQIATGEDYAAAGEGQTDEATSRLIRRFQTEQEVPKWMATDWDRFEADRKYVHTDVMMPAVKDAVCTNLVLRNQYVRLSQTYARDPDLAVQPKRRLAPIPNIEAIIDDASMVAVQLDYQEATNAFLIEMHKLGLFGQTVEILVKHFADECGFRDHLMGAIQDATTVGIAWLKVSWQEDMDADPLNNRRANDFRDTVKRLSRLAHEFEDKKWDEADDRYREMRDLVVVTRDHVRREAWKNTVWGPDEDPREMRWNLDDPKQRPPAMAELTEVPHYRGFVIDPVMPEDIRWDWTITRPEEIRKARWMAHAVRMSWDEIAEQFGKDREDVMNAAPSRKGDDGTDQRIAPSGSGTITADPQDRTDTSGAESNGQVVVWERWDRSQNKVYVWVEGATDFLRCFEPEVVSRFWFPFFPLIFNRVTGKFLPLSDTQLTKQLNDEFNLLRTHDREGRRAAYNKYIVAKGFFSDTEMTNLKSCPPEGVVECERADEVHKYFSRVIGSAYNPALYDTGKVRMDLDAMSGTSSASRGSVGQANFATEEENAAAQMEQDADRYRGRVEGVMNDVFQHMAEILVIVFPQSNAKAIAGPGAFWPHTDRETLWRNLLLEVEAGSTGKPDRQSSLAELEQIATVMAPIAAQGGHRFKTMEWMRDFLDARNSRKEPEDYFEPAPAPMHPDVAKRGAEVQQTAAITGGAPGGAPGAPGMGLPSPTGPAAPPPPGPGAPTGAAAAPGVAAGGIPA